MLYDLLHMDLTGFEVRLYPKTNALFEQKLESNPMARFAYHFLADKRSGWSTHVSKDSFYGIYQELFTGDGNPPLFRRSEK